MIEILFGESEAGLMKVAKGNKNKMQRKDNDQVVYLRENSEDINKDTFGWIDGNSREVICLAFMLDIGNIKESVDSSYRKEFIYSILNQWQWGSNSQIDEELKATGSVYVNELNRLKDYIDKGEELRIWYCDRPYSLCGFYFLCNFMKGCTNKINVVKLPEHIVRENCTVSYQNWGEVPAKEFSYFLKFEKQLLIEERWMYEIKWSELVNENMPLRVNINGNVIGVTDEFYDFLIWKKLTNKPIKQARLIGDILGNYPVSMWDGWFALRIEKFIKCGKIKLIEDSSEKYARTISLA